MESKYYTPDISELYVGFECEQYDNNSKEWKKYTVDKYIWSSNGIWKLFYDNPEESFRVKYLDKEDIENLGFTEDYGWEFTYKDYLQLPGYSYEDYIDLEYRVDTKVAYIGTSGMTVYHGIIKNKSELKTLLKWLKIT